VSNPDVLLQRYDTLPSAKHVKRYVTLLKCGSL
jgi:hypothetical protein